MDLTPTLILAGFLVGGCVGLTGVGGGSLMTPLLIGLFRVHPAVAVGTDLAFAALTRALGTAVQSNAPGADRRIVRHMLSASLPAAVLTLGWLRFGGLEPETVDLLIRQAIGAALCLTVIALIFGDRLAAAKASARSPLGGRGQAVVTVVVSFGIGALVALSSIGAGVLGCLAIALLYPGLDRREIAMTGVAVAVPLTAIAAAGHALIGHLDAMLLMQLLLGSVPGILIGTRLAARWPSRTARPLLAGALLFAAVRTVV